MKGSRNTFPKSAHASYQRARGYIAKPHSEAIATEDIISLTTLARLPIRLPTVSKLFMMNRSGWCAFWSPPISQASWHFSMPWVGISRSKPRCRASIPPTLRPSVRSRKVPRIRGQGFRDEPCSRRKNDGRGAAPLKEGQNLQDCRRIPRDCLYPPSILGKILRFAC